MKNILLMQIQKGLEIIMSKFEDIKNWCASTWSDRPYWIGSVEYFYHDMKWSIKNFFTYFKIVSGMRPWDYQYLLKMQKFQLEKLCYVIENYGHEIDEDRLPKIEKMKRAIELLDNRIEDNYADRCGYIADAKKIDFVPTKDNPKLYEMASKLQPGYEDYDEHKVFDDAGKLQEQEWNELFDLLKNNLEGWWD
jgi:hypothetical protein